MAHITADLAEQEHTGFTGTGEYTDATAAAPTARRLLSAVMTHVTSDTCFYAAIGRDSSGADAEGWEVGLGTKTATGLARTTILASSNANAAVNWATAAKVAVAIVAPASRVLQLNNAIAAVFPAAPTLPATPAAGFALLYPKKYAGRARFHMLDETGLEVGVQGSLVRDKWAIWNPPANATTVPGVFGMAAVTATGTATARNVATTNFFTRRHRLGYVSAATAGSLAGIRAAAAIWSMGVSGTPNHGGFEAIFRFGCSDAATVAGARQFVGLSSSTAAPTNVEPSTLTNSIGVGHGAADTNLRLYYGGSAAQTPIDLGANFPANTLSVDMYELTLYCPPGVNNAVYYRIKRLNTGDIADGTLTAAAPGTQLPANTTFLGLQAWRSNNATALAVGLDIGSWAIGTSE